MEPRRRPFVRFWARMLDLLIAEILFRSALPWSFQSLERVPAVYQWALSALAALLWIIPESLCLSLLGATPGKLFFRIGVVRLDNTRLTWWAAADRSLSVLVFGLGGNIPLAGLVLQALAYQDLMDTGSTRWDRDRHVVLHGRVPIWRWILMVLASVIFVAVWLSQFVRR